MKNGMFNGNGSRSKSYRRFERQRRTQPTLGVQVMNEAQLVKAAAESGLALLGRSFAIVFVSIEGKGRQIPECLRLVYGRALIRLGLPEEELHLGKVADFMVTTREANAYVLNQATAAVTVTQIRNRDKNPKAWDVFNVLSAIAADGLQVLIDSHKFWQNRTKPTTQALRRAIQAELNKLFTTEACQAMSLNGIILAPVTKQPTSFPVNLQHPWEKSAKPSKVGSTPQGADDLLASGVGGRGRG